MSDKISVLVVDDDLETRELYIRWLTGAGYLPTCTAHGREALDLFANVFFPLVLLDINMPGISGIEVLRELRGGDCSPAVIMVTGMDDPEIAASALEIGACGYLIKPFEKNELLIYLAHALRIKELEKKNREHQDSLAQQVKDRTLQLEKALRDLKASQEQLIHQEKLATIGHLAAGVAHEINNPTGYIGSNLGTLTKYLGRINEFISLLEDYSPALPPEKREELKQARKQAKIDFLLSDSRDILAECLEGVERIRKIVAGLKSFSRKDQNVSTLASINDCIENALTVAWNEVKYKATVEKEYGDLPQINCYPNQLSQVFMNLLVNAAHAITEQGTIRIRTWLENNRIVVAISDTGCGISAENQEKIFAPFFTTKKEGVGTGLGLSIVSEIVARHGGDISLRSEVGKGSTFTITIPVEQGPEQIKMS
ncbi:MAG: response regulator [Deltaproteobacteria bacterium]|nr:response regulator [Deltaproteobacteria bacterium]